MQIRPHIGADKPAVILCPSRTVITFDELEVRANRLAHGFRKADLREGDTVAILMENNEHFHAVMWAARRSVDNSSAETASRILIPPQTKRMSTAPSLSSVPVGESFSPLLDSVGCPSRLKTDHS